MKMQSLKIKNFKAFYGEYEFDFDNKSVLIYGENGSGKSSLYWALYHIFYSFDRPQSIKGYKNIFVSKEDDVVLELKFDNNEFIKYENSKFEISSEEIKDICEKITKIKLFLSYKDNFLLNELFDHNISTNSFLKILSSLYESNIKTLISDYASKQKELDNKVQSLKCSLDRTISEFKDTLKKSLIDDVTEELFLYDDIERYDNEGDLISYDTIYYFPNSYILEVEEFKNKLEQIGKLLNINSNHLKDFIYELEEVIEIVKEKSEDNYENTLTIDREPIESLGIFEDLKTRFDEFIQLYDIDKEFDEIVELLNIEISNKLQTQIEIVNKILNEDFNYQEINISINKELTLVDKQKTHPFKLNIKLNSEKLNKNHLKFLNEAKLTSINLAFYLSIILSYAELSELKILILDDLLLSLDLSNRHNFLELLMKYFSDYQIILLTHDKSFFEVAKQIFDYKQKNKWKYFEMYIDESDKIEKPKIIKHKGYFDKAKYYFAKCDYQACANYLRKEVEKTLKQILCKNINCDEYNSLQNMLNNAKSKLNSHQDKKIIERIERLVNSDLYEDMISFDKNKLVDSKDKRTIGKIQSELKRIKKDLSNKKFKEGLEELLKALEIFKDTILNPQSHDDVTKPLYKKELEEAIKLIEKLNKIVPKK